MSESTPQPPQASSSSAPSSPPIPVAEHKFKKKRPIYDSDLKKREVQDMPDPARKRSKQVAALLEFQHLAPVEQFFGIFMGIALAYGSHQLLKFAWSFFAKKAVCCELPTPPVEVPVV